MTTYKFILLIFCFVFVCLLIIRNSQV